MYQRAWTVLPGKEAKPRLAHKQVTNVCPKTCPNLMCTSLKETGNYCRGPNGRGEAQEVASSRSLSEIGERGMGG